MKEGDMNAHKKALLVLTIFAFLTLVMTGTYAWIQIPRQNANDISGKGGNDYMFVGGTLHNDHKDSDDNHDIYVENWGTRPIYTRIRLLEYMAIGPDENHEKSIIPGADVNNLDTWSIHIPSSADTPNICGDLNNPESDFHTYWLWTMGGQKYYYPAPDEKRGTAIAGAAYVDGGSPDNLDAQSPDSLYGKPVSQTLNAEVLTMRQWLDAGLPIGNYWVIDTDGWAYWADAIKPGSATGLLLDYATLVNKVNGSYRYMISVQAQMTTKENENGTYADYTKFGVSGGWTDDGKRLMELITANDRSLNITVNTDKLTASLPIVDGKIFVRQGSDVELGLRDTTSSDSAIDIIPNRVNGAQLTWEPERCEWNLHINDSTKPFTSFDLTLEGTDDSGIDAAASVIITVIPSEAGIITGRGGLPILSYDNGSCRPICDDGKGKVYPGSWIDASALQSDGFAVKSTLPLIDKTVYAEQGQSFSLGVTGISPAFSSIAGNFPAETDYYAITETISQSGCIIDIKPDTPAGTEFTVKIGQCSSNGRLIGKWQEINVVVTKKGP